jgi:thioredoxin reductase (NADPH)
MTEAVVEAEAVIIGAGPAGLFQVFELGLLGMKAHVLDSLPHPGGQCAELYPQKPIYDIPALPVCGAQELVDRLLKQIAPFEPTFHLGTEAIGLEKQPSGRFLVRTSTGKRIDAGAVIIAAGVGSFQPRRLGLPDIERFEGERIHYKVTDTARFSKRRLVVFGGGDSALDWTLALASAAAKLTLVHRRPEFRAAPASVARMRELEALGALSFLQGLAQSLCIDGDSLKGVRIKGNDGRMHELEADDLLVFFGLAPKLGPIADWGIELDRKALRVDTERFQTNIPGVFAVGDINTYPGKKKLILSGFHEAALAAFGVQAYLYPDKRQFLQYTTTSPVMHRRLGVAPPAS